MTQEQNRNDGGSDVRYSGRWRYWLFGFIPLRGYVFSVPSNKRRRGPHIWRYLGCWREVPVERDS